eukprot:14659636-Heterocapsa_arctica.AAC.1
MHEGLARALAKGVVPKRLLDQTLVPREERAGIVDDLALRPLDELIVVVCLGTTLTDVAEAGDQLLL